MALFRTLPPPTNDHLPSLMLEVAWCLHQMQTFSKIHANRGYLVGVVFSFLFLSSFMH